MKLTYLEWMLQTRKQKNEEVKGYLEMRAHCAFDMKTRLTNDFDESVNANKV